MTFCDFFHDLFKFFMTLGLAATFKSFQTFPCCKVFLTFNSSTDTNSGVHKNACRSRYLITPLCLTLPLLLSSEVSREVANQPHKTLIFHDFQGPTIKFHDLPGRKMKFLNSMTFQVFHDLHEPCSQVKKCTDLNFGEGLCTIKSPCSFPRFWTLSNGRY